MLTLSILSIKIQKKSPLKAVSSANGLAGEKGSSVI
jgi:hypothetical protein